MDRFHEVADGLMVQSGKGIKDHVGTLGGILGGYTGGNTLSTEGGPVDFSGAAAKQLFGMVGLDVKTVKKFEKHPELQQAMVLAKLGETDKSEKTIIARGIQRESGLLYQGFLTEDHLPVLNGQVITALRNTLPETAMVHKGYVGNRRLSLRVVDDRWSHDLGSGGQALTAIVVENDERGTGGLTIRTGVTRVACWNYTLEHREVFAHSSGFLLPAKLESGISTAVDSLHSIADGVAERLNSFHETTVDDVTGMLQLMSGEMGLPNYAVKAAKGWWKESGEINTVFWLVQALAFGAGSMTDRKQPQWSRRERVEYQTYQMADEYVETGVMNLCECPRCHRPMNVAEEVVDGEYTIG